MTGLWRGHFEAELFRSPPSRDDDMEKYWEQADIHCPGCREILVLRASLDEIWCPWCEEPYEISQTAHHADPSRIVLTLVKKLQSDR